MILGAVGCRNEPLPGIRPSVSVDERDGVGRGQVHQKFPGNPSSGVDERDEAGRRRARQQFPGHPTASEVPESYR